MVDEPESTADDAAPPSGGLREIVAYSLFTGLCPLIPVPLVDDWARDLLRARLAARLAAGAGVALTDSETRWLANGYVPPGVGGCARGCLRSAILKPLKFVAQLIFRKVVRTVFFFLSVKAAVDTFSETFHQAYLLRHALRTGALERSAGADPERPPQLPDPRLLEVRAAVEEVFLTADTGTVRSLARSLFRHSRRLLLATARQIPRLLRRFRREGEQAVSERLETEGEARLGGLIDELTDDLEQQRGYLEALEARLEARLAARSTPPPPATALPGR